MWDIPHTYRGFFTMQRWIPSHFTDHHPGIAAVAGRAQRRQNAGVNNTRTVKISNRPSSMARLRAHFATSLTAW